MIGTVNGGREVEVVVVVQGEGVEELQTENSEDCSGKRNVLAGAGY